MTDTGIKIVEYKGASNAAKGVRKMTAGGLWVVQSQTSYKRYWSWATGLLPFRRRRHVVTYEKNYLPEQGETVGMTSW